MMVCLKIWIFPYWSNRMLIALHRNSALQTDKKKLLISQLYLKVFFIRRSSLLMKQTFCLNIEKYVLNLIINTFLSNIRSRLAKEARLCDAFTFDGNDPPSLCLAETLGPVYFLFFLLLLPP